MTLQSSGAISMSQMRNEYGLANPVKMSDFYGKNGLPTSGAIKFSDFYGKSNFIQKLSLTVGRDTQGIGFYGYSQGGGYGNINPKSLSFYPLQGTVAATIVQFEYISNQIFISILGNRTSTGYWTKVSIGGTEFLASSFSTSYASSNNSTSFTRTGTTNPFGTSAGATKEIIFY